MRPRDPRWTTNSQMTGRYPIKTAPLSGGSVILMEDSTDDFAKYIVDLDELATSSGAMIDGDKMIWCHKGGNDANDGLTWNKAVLTIGAATILVAAETPASGDRWTIYIPDAGIYSEDVDIESWCSLIAPAATIKGDMTVDDDTYVEVYELDGVTTAAYTKTAGTGEAMLRFVRMDCAANSEGAVCDFGRLDIRGHKILTSGGDCIATGGNNVRIQANVSYLQEGSTGACVYAAGTGSTISVTVEGMKADTPIKSAGSSELNVTVAEIEDGVAAWSVQATSTLNIHYGSKNNAGNASGTATVNETRAGFIGRSPNDIHSLATVVPVAGDYALVEDASASWQKRKVNVSHYLGGGAQTWPQHIVSNVAELLAAIAAATAGEMILMLPGTYTLLASITIPDGVWLCGSGKQQTIITGAFAAALIRNANAATGSFAVGTVAAWDVSNTATVGANGLLIAAGDILQHKQPSYEQGTRASQNGTNPTYYFRPHHIQYAFGAAVTLHYYHTYNKDIRISDLTLLGDGANTTQCVTMKGGLRPRIENVLCEGWRNMGIRMEAVHYATTVDCEWRDGHWAWAYYSCTQATMTGGQVYALNNPSAAGLGFGMCLSDISCNFEKDTAAGGTDFYYSSGCCRNMLKHASTGSIASVKLYFNSNENIYLISGRSAMTDASTGNRGAFT